MIKKYIIIFFQISHIISDNRLTIVISVNTEIEKISCIKSNVRFNLVLISKVSLMNFLTSPYTTRLHSQDDKTFDISPI